MSFKNLFVFLLSTLCCASAWAKPYDGALILPVQLMPQTDAATALEPGADAWASAKATRLHLNLTPPLYAGDATDDGFRPEVSVQLLRLGDGSIIVRAQWADPTANLAGTVVAGAKDALKGKRVLCCDEQVKEKECHTTREGKDPRIP